ncbi:PREDICTED: uncharacterized protein LOC109583475 [Amphimedon queenslandica]|uniref:Uncharacterized protein n=1 Tax=Amphimedon queenslandica TaxID=400682 RepID=A0AAN0JBP3_AMPQE|nr:PREDICTED: uncharacterized protein LOC109583475 [Amphimedon queenslandica]|eukprot:XP_019854414.1 PREDICTED: uncharacterized protein LOC109583475 [Amphimedon queenslandica]
MLLQTNVNVSQWTYCPKDFGIHTVSIAAVNSVGEGEVFNYDFNVTNSVLLSNELIQQYHDGLQNWIIAIKIELSSSSSSLCISQVSLQETNSTVSYNTTNITVITMSQLIATFNIPSSVIDDRYYNFTIILSQYGSDLYTTNSSHVVIIRSSFFDVSSFTVLSTDSTNTSFMCEFVHGSQAIGCYIVMHETSIGLYYITTALRELRIGSIPGTVEPGQYSISVYDINSDGSVHLYSPAASTSIIVIALPTIESTFSSSSIPLFSISQTTTVRNLKSPTVSTASTLLTITGGVTLGLSLIVCFASIFINFSIVIWCRKKGNTMRTEEERNPSPPAQYENLEMITGTNANVNNIPTNECSAYGVVIQRH